MNRFTRFIMTALLSLMFLIAFGCTKQQTSEEASKQQSVDLTISAAASLQNALTEIKTQYEQTHDNITLFFNFGSSGALQQQIEQGAPVDLFFSASEDKFRLLVEKELIIEQEGTDLLGNELVLVVPKEKEEAVTSFQSLQNSQIKQIAIGTPDSVPAGKYAKQALTNMGLWADIEGKMIYAKDVRQVLTYTATGNVDAGIVYKTDAQTSDKVTIVEAAGEPTHDPIIYPVGVIKATKHKREAVEFYRYLQGKEALEVFQKYGFLIVQ